MPLAQLPAAASVSQARGATVRLAAPPLGGALFGLARGLPFLVDALSYAFSTVSILLMRTRFQEERVRDTAPLRKQLAEGLRFLSHVPFLRTTMLMIAASNFSTTGVQLAVIVLAKRQGLSSASIGAFVALVGVTTLLGSVASPLLRRFLSMHTILLSEFWAGVAYVPFFVWPSVYVLAVCIRSAGLLLPEHRLRRHGVLVRVDARPARRARDVGLEHAATCSPSRSVRSRPDCCSARRRRVRRSPSSPAGRSRPRSSGTFSSSIRSAPRLEDLVTPAASPAEAG